MSEKEFELNIGDIESTAWIEVNPVTLGEFCDIYLYIDWEEQTAEIVTEYGNSMDYRVYMNLASEYRIPVDTDAKQFEKYYNDNVKPLIIDQAGHFEKYWDGSNWKGRFRENVVNQYRDYYIGNDNEITWKLEGAPTLDIFIYGSVSDSFLYYEDIINVLRHADIDFMTVNLNDIDIIRKIRECMEDDVIYIMTDEQFQADVIGMRNTIIENMED